MKSIIILVGIALLILSAATACERSIEDEQASILAEATAIAEARQEIEDESKRAITDERRQKVMDKRQDLADREDAFIERQYAFARRDAAEREKRRQDALSKVKGYLSDDGAQTRLDAVNAALGDYAPIESTGELSGLILEVRLDGEYIMTDIVVERPHLGTTVDVTIFITIDNTGVFDVRTAVTPMSMMHAIIIGCVYSGVIDDSISEDIYPKVNQLRRSYEDITWWFDAPLHDSTGPVPPPHVLSNSWHHEMSAMKVRITGRALYEGGEDVFKYGYLVDGECGLGKYSASLQVR